MEFAEKLITLRNSKKLTQEQLADMQNVSRQSVSKWENGQVIPDVEKIVELSKTFDVTIDYLLKPSKIDELSVKTEILEQQQNGQPSPLFGDVGVPPHLIPKSVSGSLQWPALCCFCHSSTDSVSLFRRFWSHA